MIEADVQNTILCAAPEQSCILMRNNVGALTDADGRIVRYGLMNTSKQQNERIKSSDLIGITTVIITPEMVGQRVGIFTAVEVKRTDWQRSETDKHEIAQEAFIAWVKARGGFAGFANSLDSFLKILQK